MQIELAPAVTSPRRARRFVTHALHEFGRETCTDTAVLLVSELVTNAILHARSPVVLRVEDTNPALRVEVEDSSPLAPVQRRFGPEAATGRGMLLVQALADAWGTELHADGKTVWFQLEDAGDDGR